MGLLNKNPLKKPKVDLANVAVDVSIPPVDQVKIMSPLAFEQFITEWLYGCRINQYDRIVNIGGAGDKGRDVIGYYKDGTCDYFQCKHYESPLMPSDYYLELGKLCYFTYSKEYEMPNKYYIMASNDIGPSLQDLLKNFDKLKEALLKNWDSYCKRGITKTTEIKLDDRLRNYINFFDFSVIECFPIAKVINEHLATMYGNIRFGGIQVEKPVKVKIPEKYENEELKYIKELFMTYSEKLGKKINSIDDLKEFSKYLENFQRQRKSYFAAETIRRFVRDTFTDSKEFEVLKEEIYDGIIDTCMEEYTLGMERLNAVMKQVVSVSTTKSLLDCKMKYIGNSEKRVSVICWLAILIVRLYFLLKGRKRYRGLMIGNPFFP